MTRTIELDYSPYPYQIEVHTDPHRFKVIVGGRRVGKTKLALQECIKRAAIKPNQLIWWVAPTYKDAEEVGWSELETYKEFLEPAIKTWSISKLYVEFVNGSRIYFKGSDKFDSLRGRGLNFCVMDEAAFCHKDAWTKAIRPALSDKQGEALIISTANGRNWFYEQFKHASYDSVKSWAAWHWPTAINPLISQEDLDDARANLSQMDFEQEYLARFITKAGMVYNEFSESNILDSFTIDLDRHDIYVGMDFGYASYTAAVFVAVDRATNIVTQFDELYVSRHDIHDIFNLTCGVLHRNGCGWPKAVYTDPAGNAEELSSGLSPVDYLRKQGLTIINKASRIAPGLAMVRAFILNAQKQSRFFITSNCEHTIKSFYGYSYRMYKDQPQEEPEKDGIHDHLMDALRYFFVNKFDQARYVAGKPEQLPYSSKPRGAGTMKRCQKCKSMFFSRSGKYEPPYVCSSC